MDLLASRVVAERCAPPLTPFLYRFFSRVLAVALLLALLLPSSAAAQPQSKAQRVCIKSVGLGYLRVARAERRGLAHCVQQATRGELSDSTIAECSAEDSNGNVANTRQRALGRETARCKVPPDFAYRGQGLALDQAIAAERSLIMELFGSDPDAAIASIGTDPEAARCQRTVLRRAGKCQNTILKHHNRCVERALKDGATEASALLACEGDDPKLVVAKVCNTSLAKDVSARCSSVAPDVVVPGCRGEDLVTCIADRVQARTRVALDAARALSPIRILLFSRTAGFRHVSIADAHDFFSGLPVEEGIRSYISESPFVFTQPGLEPFDVLLFANTTGDVLNENQQQAMQAFIRSGRGFVGAHSAADTEHDWPWYGDLVGAYFRSHPILPVEVEVTTEIGDHPSTDHLPPTFLFTDEIYNLDRNPRLDNQILLTIDEAGFIYPNIPAGPSMGEDHPIAWYTEFEGARSFYTNLGHRPQTWQNPVFQEHLLGGIRWVAEGISYSRIIVTEEASNPLALAATPGGDVYYIERTGEVRLWNHVTGQVSEAALIPVDTAAENGLLGIALDPSFSSNGWIYLYHSEPVPVPPPASGPPGENVLSRFTTLFDGSLDMSSRVDLLRVPSDRECCHEAGSIVFAPDGTLFLSTGDETNPHEAQGFAPLDERPGRDLYNSQRTAPNPFDLRGKILRINPDGTIPPGNLYPSDGTLGLPQIYAIGVRNPFRMAIDSVTGRLFWGDVGPDGFFDGERGPRGMDEINIADAPGDYGWPYCIGDGVPYADYDFDTMVVGSLFDCSGTVPATLYYDYFNLTHPVLGTATDNIEIVAFTGRTAIAGTFYREPNPGAPFTLPVPFLESLLMTEWTRDLIAAVEIDGAGDFVRLERLMPWERFIRPIDLDVGPDGALYVLEYGSAFFGNNPDARLSRVEYSTAGELSPVAVINAAEVEGEANTFEFSGAGSYVPQRGETVTGYDWDFNGDGTVDASGVDVQHTFITTGLFPVTLKVETDRGRSSIPSVEPIVIGNTAPVVTITSHEDDETVPSGITVVVVATAIDSEDGPVPCNAIRWRRRLGHNAHSHPVGLPSVGCTLSFDSSLPTHGDSLGLFWTVEATVTDNGGPGGEPALTGSAGVRIRVAP